MRRLSKSDNHQLSRAAVPRFTLLSDVLLHTSHSPFAWSLRSSLSGLELRFPGLNLQFVKVCFVIAVRLTVLLTFKPTQSLLSSSMKRSFFLISESDAGNSSPAPPSLHGRLPAPPTASRRLTRPPPGRPARAAVAPIP